jgi:hypothetical protein
VNQRFASDGAEGARHEPRAEPADEAEQEDELPDLGRQRRQRHPRCGEEQRHDGQPPDPEAINEDARDGPTEPEQQQAGRSGQ